MPETAVKIQKKVAIQVSLLIQDPVNVINNNTFQKLPNINLSDNVTPIYRYNSKLKLPIPREFNENIIDIQV